MKNKEYDLIIIGCGVASCFFLEEYLKNNSEKRILIIEKAKDIGGLLTNEGKFNFDYCFGGKLGKFINPAEQDEYYQRLKVILNQVKSNDRGKLNFNDHNHSFKISEHEFTHLGRKNTLELKVYFKRQINKNKIEVKVNCKALGIGKQGKLITVQTKHGDYWTHKLIIATNNQDLIPAKFIQDKITLKYGARLEFPSKYFEKLLANNQEIKFQHQQLESYCFNKNGFIAPKTWNNFVYADGVNQYERKHQSNRTNFVMFISKTGPKTEIIQFLNTLSEKYSCKSKYHQLLIEDLLAQNHLSTLYCKELKKFIQTLSYETGINYEQLIKSNAYLFDFKIYNEELNLTNNLELFTNCYCIGDCSGYSNSLSYAGVMGLLLADIFNSDKQ